MKKNHSRAPPGRGNAQTRNAAYRGSQSQAWENAEDARRKKKERKRQPAKK